ncbi:type II toxin-antitoxin system RelE/ParE family toxin [Gloeothece verrucosa]|uniref:Toxin n=1 Tax=Gloeothece verrucosa (strain PCC 7822) TaxID=497965 RepID=E0UGN7_GLOV7|nr:type II toxin-antitoxin system RelE/ParE family toxin [Gloeothece verrucosa]ADN13246.1 plasmid stabilization system [Gloeothece verrucosa PCC 7822]
MNRFRLSRQAEQDLEDIWVYLAQQDELLADQQIAQILNRFPMLSQFPDLGKQRDDLLVGLRSFPVKPYLIFYTKTVEGIEIIRVLHQARDVNRQFS